MTHITLNENTADEYAAALHANLVVYLTLVDSIVASNNIPAGSNQGGAILSDDLVQKAARLMNKDKNVINETSTSKKTQQPLLKQQQSSINLNEIRDIVRETVEDVLKENGLLVESTSRTNDLFTFKVGKHIFEGKLTKIKKIS
jgi:hypothetical protein